MRVTREVAVAAPPAALWALLWDVPRMVECVPGCLEAREVERESRYTARMRHKVGPISLSIDLDVDVTAAEPPRSIALRARGRDPLVKTEMTLRVRLECEARDAGSLLRIDADGQVLGRLGGLGQGVIQRKAEEAVDEFASRVASVASR